METQPAEAPLQYHNTQPVKFDLDLDLYIFIVITYVSLSNNVIHMRLYSNKLNIIIKYIPRIAK